MNHKTQQWLIEFANKAAKIPFVKITLKPFYYKYKDILQKKRNRLFRKNALSVLQLFDKCCEENSIKYTLAFGTLLGAVREQGFIKHDIDIDVCVWNNEYSDHIPNSLRKYGFKLMHTFLVDNGRLGREETYYLNGISIDIFYFYENNNDYPYCCDFLTYGNSPTFRKSMEVHGKVLPRRIELPLSREREKVRFETIELYVPKNATEILTFRYGEDYMTPKPNWNVRSHDTHIVEWHEEKGIYVEYND